LEEVFGELKKCTAHHKINYLYTFPHFAAFGGSLRPQSAGQKAWDKSVHARKIASAFLRSGSGGALSIQIQSVYAFFLPGR